MSAFFEGRPSDSPYIDFVWRGRNERDYAPVCPADVRWNLLFRRLNDKVFVTAEGATTGFVAKYQPEASEFLVIKFNLGVYMPHLPAGHLVDGDVALPEGAGKSFWLNSSTWQFPDYDNVETFVDRLVRDEILVCDPVVTAVLQDDLPELSFRTIRRRFLHATGLTHGSIQQIERAKEAAALLTRGVPILDTVYETGYADQPHMTRSLKRFFGQTPAQIAQEAT